MPVRSISLANDPVAQEAAEEHLLGNGSALGAVLSAFFAASGAYAGVLLGPVSIVVGGLGAGARAFDGRLRQPGLGSKRPRGFKPDEMIPDAARVAVPVGVAAALVAAAYDGDLKLRTVMKPGIAAAVRSGAQERAELLRRIRSVGAAALTEPSFVRPLLRLAGPSEGGLLSPADFNQRAELDFECQERVVEGMSFHEPGWAQDERLFSAEVSEAALADCRYAVLAVDVRGVFAALSYQRSQDGILVDELEVELPLVAVPVQRGVERVPPGSRLPAPTPLALGNEAGAVSSALAAPTEAALSDALLARPPMKVERIAGRREVRAVTP